MWEAGPRPRWWRCVGGQESASVGRENRVGFGADKRCLGTTSEGRERIRRSRLQKRAKQMATEQQRAEESTRGEAMRKKRTRMRQDAEMQPSLAWKWSSWFLERPPAQSPLSATHSRPFARGSPARCGPVGTGRLQGARAGIGRWCSTAFAQYLRRYGAQGRQYLAHVAQCWMLLAV